MSSFAAVRNLTPLMRRSTKFPITRQTTVSKTSIRELGSTPPLAPFARIPAPTQKLVEHHDSVWDDGVAPEVALDYDCQHVSSTEGLLSWLGGLTGFALLFQFVKSTDPESKNPAVNRTLNVVVDSPRRGPPSSSD